MAHGPPARRKSSTHQNDINLEEESELPIPPDGGWGWMVSIASFMIHIITDGITYSFGMFYTDFLTYFNQDQFYTAWIVSTLVGVTLCSGPISSSFVNRYGCRPVTIAGAILAAVCIFISVFAQNVLTLIITIGIGAGMGFGLIYLPAIVSVTMYFEKYRSLATGIAVCGSGLGTFVFAPLTESLIGNYGWRGAMLIISAIVLNCILFGAMFRPLELPKKSKRNQIKNDTKKLENSNNYELQPLNNNKTNTRNAFAINDLNDGSMQRSYSIGYISNSNKAKNHNNNTNGHVNSGTLPLKKTNSSNGIRASVSQPHIFVEGVSHLHDTKSLSGSGTMYRRDIFYQGSLLNIPEYKSRGSVSMDSNRYGSVRAEIISSQQQSKLCGCVPCSKETHDTFSEMMNFSLFRDVIFIIFTISNFCTSLGFNVPYVYLAPQAKILELSTEQASWLLSTIGIANTLGRIVLGYIADKPWVNRLLIYNACLTICGIATCLSIYCNDFISLILYSSVFGFTIGAYVGLTSVILVDLIGLDKLTNAFGLLLLFQGLASFIGPPFAGWLFDITGSYAPGFLMAGITMAISGVILFLIPPLQRIIKQRKQLRGENTFSL